MTAIALLTFTTAHAKTITVAYPIGAKSVASLNQVKGKVAGVTGGVTEFATVEALAWSPTGKR